MPPFDLNNMFIRSVLLNNNAPSQGEAKGGKRRKRKKWNFHCSPLKVIPLK